MRGRFQDQGGLFSYISAEKRVPGNHPLRKVRDLVREVLKELSRSFEKLYSHEGRADLPGPGDDARRSRSSRASRHDLRNECRQLPAGAALERTKTPGAGRQPTRATIKTSS